MAEVDQPAAGGTFAGSTTDRGRTPGGRFQGDGISGFVAQVLSDSILWIGTNPPSADQYVLWINTEDGRWYGKWSDGDSVQWVDMSLPFGEGLPGPRGPQGERGITGTVGTGIPTGGLANEILVKLDGTDYNTAWGARPADGLNVLGGAGDPDDVTDGVDGEFYINTSTYDIFGPKTAGAWGSGTSLIGPQGPQGDEGPAGNDGADGTNGTDGTDGTDGVDGSNGVGIPTGGTVGQVLAKVDSTDYNTNWVDQSGGGGGPSYVALLEGNTGAQNATVLQGVIDGGELNILLPSGTFEMEQVDLVSNVRITGTGIDNTILVAPAKTITDIDGYGGTLNVHGTIGTHIENVVIEDLTIDGNKSNITVAGSTDENDIEAIDFLYADNCVTYRVKCIDTVGEGLDYDSCYRCTNYDCIGENCGGYANHFSANSEECTSFALSATDCGDDNLRGGFDTHASSTKCAYINPRTTDCYRGGYINGDYSVVKGHVDEASVNNGLRVSGSYCSIDGHWKGTVSGNGMTIESGAAYNKFTGIAEGSGATGFNFLSGSNRNSISVIAEGNTATGIQISGNNNAVFGCVARNNGTFQINNTGADNNLEANITT